MPSDDPPVLVFRTIQSARSPIIPNATTPPMTAPAITPGLVPPPDDTFSSGAPVWEATDEEVVVVI